MLRVGCDGVAVGLAGVVCFEELCEFVEERDPCCGGLVGEVEGDGDERRGLVVHGSGPHEGRGLGARGARAGFGAFGGAFSGFLEPIAFAVELDDFAAMDEAVDEGDDTGGGGEHVGHSEKGLLVVTMMERWRYRRVTTSKRRSA